MTTPANPCPLCKRQARLTAEDVLPLWLRRELLLLEPSLSAGQGPRRSKLRVCHECNERMGKTFEAPASALLKPLVRGEAATFTLDEQFVIAGWIAKTTLLGLIKRTDISDPWQGLLVQILRQTIEMGRPSGPASVRLFKMQHHISAASSPNLRRILPGAVPHPVAVFGVSWFGYLGYEFVLSEMNTVMPYALATRHHPHSVHVSPGSRRQVRWPPPRRTLPEDLVALRDRHGEGRDAEVAPPFEEIWDLPDVSGTW